VGTPRNNKENTDRVAGMDFVGDYLLISRGRCLKNRSKSLLILHTLMGTRIG
jgi:hypothetical protein